MSGRLASDPVDHEPAQPPRKGLGLEGGARRGGEPAQLVGLSAIVGKIPDLQRGEPLARPCARAPEPARVEGHDVRPVHWRSSGSQGHGDVGQSTRPNEHPLHPPRSVAETFHEDVILARPQQVEPESPIRKGACAPRDPGDEVPHRHLGSVEGQPARALNRALQRPDREGLRLRISGRSHCAYDEAQPDRTPSPRST